MLKEMISLPSVRSQNESHFAHFDALVLVLKPGLHVDFTLLVEGMIECLVNLRTSPSWYLNNCLDDFLVKIERFKV
jgi:hypothetical protein